MSISLIIQLFGFTLLASAISLALAIGIFNERFRMKNLTWGRGSNQPMSRGSCLFFSIGFMILAASLVRGLIDSKPPSPQVIMAAVTAMLLFRFFEFIVWKHRERERK